MSPATLDLAVTNAELARVFEPFVAVRFDGDTPEWREHTGALARRLRRARIRHAVMRLLPGHTRTQEAVRLNYDQQWSSLPIEQQVSVEGPTVACRWGSQRMQARAIGIKRVYLLLFSRLIEQLKPSSVLEVGCGNGLNLFWLASRFPAIRFAGIELTEGGLAALTRVARLPELPQPLRAFFPEPVPGAPARGRILPIRGSAAQLPFRAGAFDLVFTSLALEQMEPIRPQALNELRRVARGHVAMLEPFRDWNDEGLAKDYALANDYFAGRVADLSAHGLQPIVVMDDLPAKLFNRPGLVVCRTA